MLYNSVPIMSFLNQKRVGTSLKEKHTGRLANEWTAATGAPERAGSFEWVEVAPVLSLAMSVKDEDELVCLLVDMSIFIRLIKHSLTNAAFSAYGGTFGVRHHDALVRPEARRYPRQAKQNTAFFVCGIPRGASRQPRDVEGSRYARFQ